jgi:hypothetical protein
MVRTALLVCGILSSLLYVGTDLFAAMRYEGYSYTAQVISELAAIGAPTQSLVSPLFTAYDVHLIAFAAGVWASAGGKRALRVVAGLLAGVALVGSVWFFFPMHMRGTGITLTDTVHAVIAGVVSLLILLAIGFGATAFGKRFRRYSIATILILLVSGVLTGLDAPRIQANLPTPWVGVMERINLLGYLLWVAVLAIALLRAPPEPRVSQSGIRSIGSVGP